ncbi:MAG: peptidase M22 [Clostridia bacterium]|nr:peptidase M22 [Clostridia bacterium]
MKAFLGIDTSNYTTSVAAVFENGKTESVKIPLKVKSGEKGVRQSDALFMHTVNLPNAIRQLFQKIGDCEIAAVGVSTRPRNIEGSYMPCFLAGISAASACAESLKVPLFEFSHQEGHIMAAFCESGHNVDEYDEFLAFHISGGTNDMMRVVWNGKFEITQIGWSKDITSGQLIDRCGVMLGIDFPCGKQLEKLASDSDKFIKPKICVNNCECNISGAENQCKKLFESGELPSNIAQYVLNFVYFTLDEMLTQSTLSHLPILFVGGVMSNSFLRTKFSQKYNCIFALPEYSCDNACGIAELSRRSFNV